MIAFSLFWCVETHQPPAFGGDGTLVGDFWAGASGSCGVGVAGPHGAFRHCWKAFCGCWQPPARLSAVGTLRIGKHSLEDWKALQRHGFLVHGLSSGVCDGQPFK